MDSQSRGPGRPATVIPGADAIIARERANGASWASCAHTLNAAGLERPTGGEWTASAAASYAKVNGVSGFKPEPTEWWPDGEGARFRAARIAAGVPIIELARVSGVTRATVWNVESGATMPRADTAARLRDAMRRITGS